MASGRVGGTRSKISGQVGKDIYEVRRNPDGTYTQIVYAKGEPTATTTTPRLQAQRMCTAMVESMMRDLKEVAKISMQSAANKSKSLNAFSSWNLQRVAQDCKANWYGNNQFTFPYTLDVVQNLADLGGPYMMSAGTLQFNCFDELAHIKMAGRYYDNIRYPRNLLNGLKFIAKVSQVTLSEFMKKHRMTRIDILVYPFYRLWETIDPKTEEPVMHAKNEYIMLQINPAIPDSAVLSSSVINQLFLIKSSVDVSVCIAKDNTNFVLGYACNMDELGEDAYYHAGFTISYLEGKKKISTSYYHNPDGWSTPAFVNQAPTDVFGSWMGEPWIHHYPSPFQTQNK